LVRQGASAPDRQALFRRWALAGAGSGAAIAILRAPFAWAGDGVAANIGNLAGHVLIFTLLALAGCWVWQRQQAS
jgi:hypothetical protein